MRKCSIILIAFTITLFTFASASADPLNDYIKNFDYAARKDMKVSADQLADMMVEKSVLLVDIRFQEEYLAWRMGFGVNIPLPELPDRLKELPKNKIIVTACPHKDRAIIAMVYLRSNGFKAKYLSDGLIGLAELLRGDEARDLMEK